VWFATDSAITHVHGLPLTAPPTPAWEKLTTNNYKIPTTNNVAHDRPDHIHIPCTAYAGHICAERLGDLHGERSHASRCTIDQDLLPRLNPSLVPKTLQSRESRNRGTSRLLERHVIRFHDQSRFHELRRLAGTRIFGKCSAACAEHRVAWFELRYVPAHRFNLASHINAELFDLWLAQPEQ
jgi:hypothetical protein